MQNQKQTPNNGRFERKSTLKIMNQPPQNDEEEQFYSMISDKDLVWEIQDEPEQKRGRQYRNTYSTQRSKIQSENSFRIFDPDEMFQNLEKQDQQKPANLTNKNEQQEKISMKKIQNSPITVTKKQVIEEKEKPIPPKMVNQTVSIKVQSKVSQNPEKILQTKEINPQKMNKIQAKTKIQVQKGKQAQSKRINEIQEKKQVTGVKQINQINTIQKQTKGKEVKQLKIETTINEVKQPSKAIVKQPQKVEIKQIQSVKQTQQATKEKDAKQIKVIKEEIQIKDQKQIKVKEEIRVEVKQNKTNEISNQKQIPIQSKEKIQEKKEFNVPSSIKEKSSETVQIKEIIEQKNIQNQTLEKEEKINASLMTTQIFSKQTEQKHEGNEDDMVPYHLGKCLLREEYNTEYRKIQFLMNKTYINFASFDEHLKISWIKKIKFISNRLNKSQMRLKLTFESDGNRISQNKETNIFLCADFQTLYLFFSGVIVRKMIEHAYKYKEKIVPLFEQREGNIEGIIDKRSRHLKKWHKRNVQIKQNLKSFKGEKCTYVIKRVSQIWTRFEIHNGYLVLKLLNSIEKVQFGIPISNFVNVKEENNWLYAFCYLLIQE